MWASVDRLGRCDRNSEFLQTGNHWHRETHHRDSLLKQMVPSIPGRRSELHRGTLPTWALSYPISSAGKLH